MRSVLIFVVTIGLASAASDVSSGVTISNVERIVDASTQIIRETVKFDASNSGQKAAKEIVIGVPTKHADHVAFVSAKTNEKVLKCDKTTVSGHNEMAFYAVQLSRALGAGDTTTIELEITLVHALAPFPKEIVQAENQKVVFEHSANFLVPYPVKDQKTSIKLASASVESFTKDKSVDPASQESSSIVYGPYNDVAAYEEKAVRIHFQNDKPFLTITDLERVIEVSHWGTVSVEEHIHIVHTGAKLKGSFSRYDFQRDHRPTMPAVKSFKTLLPAAAVDVYYRDEIGNISTSSLRDRANAVELEVRPRFPLFGGWQTRYTIGYNIPSYEYLYSTGSKFSLKMRFIDHIFDDFVIDNVVLKIILPERVKNIKVETPYPAKRLKDLTHFTYLDYSGRPVVQLQKSNLVEQHIANFEISYNFDQTTMLYEPIMVVVSFYLLFLAVIIYVRMDFTISKDAGSEARMKLAGILESIKSTGEERTGAYDKFMEAIEKCKGARDVASLGNIRKKIEADLKRLNQTITDMGTSLKADAADLAEKVSDGQKLDRSIRDLLASYSQAVERLVSGKLPKGQFADIEKQAKAKIEEMKLKIENALYSL